MTDWSPAAHQKRLEFLQSARWAKKYKKWRKINKLAFAISAFCILLLAWYFFPLPTFAIIKMGEVPTLNPTRESVWFILDAEWQNWYQDEDNQLALSKEILARAGLANPSRDNLREVRQRIMDANKWRFISLPSLIDLRGLKAEEVHIEVSP